VVRFLYVSQIKMLGSYSKEGVFRLQKFLNQTFFNNIIMDYLIFLGSLILSILVLTIIRKVVLKRLHAWAGKAETTINSTLVRGISKYLLPLLYFVAFYLCTKILSLNTILTRFIDIATTAFMIIFGTVFISSFLIFLFNKHWEKKNKNADKLALKWFSVIIRILTWTLALLLFLDNIGIKITTLITSFGIGGIAIAFAAQAILEDMFSFFTIFLDRPFEVDDFIIVDDLMGTVEQIGIKTTRIRSINGEQLIFSNKDLTSSRLRNYKRMQNRRALLKLGVQYDTPLEKLKEIPGLIRCIIENIADTKFDRAHFSEYADYSLKFEIVYYILSQDYNVYMDIQQEINFLIKEEFDKRDINFAYPTQTLYMQNSSHLTTNDQEKD